MYIYILIYLYTCILPPLRPVISCPPPALLARQSACAAGLRQLPLGSQHRDAPFVLAPRCSREAKA